MGVVVRYVDAKEQYFIFVNHKGQRKAYAAGTNEVKATKAAKEMESELLRGKLGLKKALKGCPTLTAHFAAWLSVDGIAGQACKRGAVKTYRNMAECYIKPVLGDKKISEITHDHCIDLIKYWKTKGNRSATLKLIARTLSSALTASQYVTGVNPAFKLAKYFKCPDEIKHKPKWYSREDSDKFLTSAKLGDPVMYRLWLVAFRAGLRHGELLGLQWGDFDFRTKLINVERTVDQDGLNPTAPKHGQRYVDMSDEVVDYLKPLSRQFAADALLCPDDDGATRSQRDVLTLFHKATRIAKVKRAGIHAIRHSFASQLLQGGAPLNYVKEQLGHSSIQITADLYGHLVPSANRQFVNQLTAAPVAVEGAA